MWGDEQTQGYNPIAPGQQFEILILVDQASYKVRKISKISLTQLWKLSYQGCTPKKK